MNAIDDVIGAWEQVGWVAALREEVNGSSPNPTRVDLVRRKQRLALLVYAWKVTGEGKGRTGTNYRIQTTRSHDSDLLTEPKRLTIGFGIDAERGVLAVFDGWTKRATGRSSSVHIERGTLEAAQRDGYAEAGYPWDSRAATRIAQPDNLLPWISNQYETRTAAVHPVEHSIDHDAATIVADLWNAPTASWLRPGDRLVMADTAGESLLDTALWAVESVNVTIVNPGERYPRRRATFVCRRTGRVRNNAADLLRGLSGRRPRS
ncbi:hypothetical protein WSS_A22018 [Rhodococcus opacus M213]|uniref:Methylase-associated X1 domain-containing protein n=1 Tax=Rhodococcus opacus M213 TaxID=1129896 RepID=K8XIA2_RHOOP|nr:hypothetical protein [Rhodococcus opacus]EKT80496.1 hypothetical protein WSS_A22018 [Rhodococcus opacus M213]